MKFALVFLNQKEVAPPLGVAYIASYLKEYSKIDDLDVIIVDKEDHMKRIQKEKPDIVGISSVTKEFSETQQFAKEVKSKFNIPVIIGGVHITSVPNSLDTSFDLGVLGEGEQTTLELLDSYKRFGTFKPEELKKIDGIAFRNNGKLSITKPRQFITPLDKIPPPARDLLKMKEFYLRPSRTAPDKIGRGTSMMTSRGCPYNCVYCASPAFWRRTLRFHSAQYVVDEINQIVNEYKVDSIRIWDDLFIADVKRLEEIIKLIRNEGLNDKIEFYIYGRANLMTEKIVKLLKSMNVNYISFGLESGSDKILQFLKGKNVTAKQNREAVELSKKHGLFVDATFILGSPDETKEDIEKTLNLIKNESIDMSSVCSLTPFPGTVLWDYIKKEKMIKEDGDINWDTVNLKSFQDGLYMNKTMSKEEFAELTKKVSQVCNEKNSQTLKKIPVKYLFDTSLYKHIFKEPRRFLRLAYFRIISKIKKW